MVTLYKKMNHYIVGTFCKTQCAKINLDVRLQNALLIIYFNLHLCLEDSHSNRHSCPP